MGQELKTAGQKIFNLDDRREVQYWTHRLGITKAQLQTLSDVIDRQDPPTAPSSVLVAAPRSRSR